MVALNVRFATDCVKTGHSAPHLIPDIQTETLPAISIIGICATASHYGGITVTLYLTPKLGNGIWGLRKVSP